MARMSSARALLDEPGHLPGGGLLALHLDGLLPEAVGVGQVAEGGVEDQHGASLHGGQDLPQPAVQLLQLPHEAGAAGLVGRPPRRVHQGQPVADVGRHHRHPAGVQPDMRVGFPFRVAVLLPGVGLHRAQLDPFRRIEHGEAGQHAPEALEEGLLERDADAEVDPRLGQGGHLSRGGLEGLRGLPGLDQGLRPHPLPADPLDEGHLGQDADEDGEAVRCRTRGRGARRRGAGFPPRAAGRKQQGRQDGQERGGRQGEPLHRRPSAPPGSDAAGPDGPEPTLRARPGSERNRTPRREPRSRDTRAGGGAP